MPDSGGKAQNTRQCIATRTRQQTDRGVSRLECFIVSRHLFKQFEPLVLLVVSYRFGSHCCNTHFDCPCVRTSAKPLLLSCNGCHLLNSNSEFGRVSQSHSKVQSDCYLGLRYPRRSTALLLNPIAFGKRERALDSTNLYVVWQKFPQWIPNGSVAVTCSMAAVADRISNGLQLKMAALITTRTVFGLAAVIRLVLLLYGEWQDNHSESPTTVLHLTWCIITVCMLTCWSLEAVRGGGVRERRLLS